MLERYENNTAASALQLTDYINEATDSIRTIVALGRERETMRLLGVKAQTAPSGTQYLMLGACGFALAQAMVMWMGALMFYRSSQRIAAHVVGVYTHTQSVSNADQRALLYRVLTRFTQSSKLGSSRPLVQGDSSHFLATMREQSARLRL